MAHGTGINARSTAAVHKRLAPEPIRLALGRVESRRETHMTNTPDPAPDPQPQIVGLLTKIHHQLANLISVGLLIAFILFVIALLGAWLVLTR